MNELLANPAVQSAVAPFMVAFALSTVLVRTHFLALAQVAGFAALAALAIGFSFEAMTSGKKMMLIGLATAIAVIVLEWRGAPARRWQGGVTAAIALASVWMLWRLLAQKELSSAILTGALATLYVAWLVGSTLWAGRDPVRGASAGLMLGLGTGALAVLGASAVLGLVGISVGAAAGATLLVQMVRGRVAESGFTISLPASTVAALAGVLAVVSASLPWYCLLPVLITPLATLLVPISARPLWLRACITSLAALVPMLVAMTLAWAPSAAS